jgi:hypothetical protein
MERTYEMLLTAIVIIVCCWSMEMSRQTNLQIERMNQQIQMMFIKS